MPDPSPNDDLPYGDDWQSSEETAAWTEASDRKRPWRALIRAFIAEQCAALRPGARVLELGSGPGFLAERVLEGCPDLASYTLLDFSEPLMAVSRSRLEKFSAASFVLTSFKDPGWVEHAAGPFDAVLSMQAVHELRHKRHAAGLYQQVHGMTASGGVVLVCDHLPWDDSPFCTTLFMTEEEQTRALALAGFFGVGVALSINGLVVYRGRRARVAFDAFR